MDFVFDLLQAAGIAAAVGIRPFLPVAAGRRARRGDLGMDFDGTDFAFLEESPFLLAVGRRARRCSTWSRRRAGRDAASRLVLHVARGRRASSLGALLAAPARSPTTATRWSPASSSASSAPRSASPRARSLFARVRSAPGPEARRRAAALRARRAALAAAGLSVLFPPLAILVIAALAWLLAGGRRRAGEKYAGLRILR